MKIFTTLLVTIVAFTKAQNGFNFYQQQHHPSITQILSEAVHQQTQQDQPIQVQSYSQLSQQYLPPLPGSFPMPRGFPVATAAKQPVHKTRRYRPRVKIPKRPLVTKNFFIHTAPDESDEDVQEELSQLSEEPRKHYNVLFVKTPSQTNKVAVASLAKALKQEKTVVYVLSKKTTASDLQDAIAEAPQTINKPEVYFIKYRTPEEAAHAQRQIQSQYDNLGGSSTITDEGVSPITSVVGTLDAPEEDENDEYQQLQQEGEQNQHQEQNHFDHQLANNINHIIGGGTVSINNQYLSPN